MKKYYLAIPSLLIFVFAFAYSDWSKKNRSHEQALLIEAQAKAVEESEAKARYQAEIQRKAKIASEEIARKKAEMETRNREEERYWNELNQELNTAISEREALTEKVYETTHFLFLEQERHIRAKESMERQNESERFLVQYVPEARANRDEIRNLLEKAENLTAARKANANPKTK